VTEPHPGQSKVGDLDGESTTISPAALDQYVPGLQVTMDHILAVKVDHALITQHHNH
jgi:ethanolamine utilization microcompartment shell protein EutS